MKKWIVGCFLLGLTACGGNQQPKDQVGERARLEREMAQKDSLLNDLFASLNEISGNLTEIKDREGLVTSNVSAEIRKEQRVQIVEDIAAINDLLERNRASLVRLQEITEKLRKSNLQVRELELLVSGLAKQIQDKDTDIALLKQELENREVRLAELSTEVEGLQANAAALTEDRQSLASKLDVQDDMLHTVYYIVGRERDLREADIVDKSGFIGRTVTVNNAYDLDKFTRADSRHLDRILVGQRKAVVVTAHPEGSYTLETDGNNLLHAIEITDPQRFWESSKVLVVSYK